MATTEKYLLANTTVILTTGDLSSLANNSNALGQAFDNTQTATGDGYILADFELVTGQMASNPTPATGFSLYILQTIDGSNYEDGGTTVTPSGKIPDIVFGLRPTGAPQRIVRRGLLPWGQWKPLLRNDGTGVSMSVSGNTLTIRPVTRQLI